MAQVCMKVDNPRVPAQNIVRIVLRCPFASPCFLPRSIRMQQLPPASKITIVSDLHIGRGDGPIWIYGTPEPAFSLVLTIAKTADLSSISGDASDIARGSLPTAQKRACDCLRVRGSSVEA